MALDFAKLNDSRTPSPAFPGERGGLVSFNPAPTDPAYAAFLAGLNAVAADPTGRANDRWHALQSHWFTYDPAKWVPITRIGWLR